MNKFIDIGEDEYTQNYYQDDIAYMPHLYNIRWAQKLNNVLSKVFYSPFLYTERSYQTGKSDKHEYIAKLLPKLRSGNMSKVFIGNLVEDFDYDFAKAGNVNEFYGILHSSNYLSQELHGNSKMKLYEKFVVSYSKKVFVATPYFQSKVPYETTVIGLPIHDKFREPRVEFDQILFNHRLMADRQPTLLIDFPEDLKKRVFITIPNAVQSPYMPLLSKEFGERFMNCNYSEGLYIKNLFNSGFGVSFAKQETFGYGVVEGLTYGLCYFAPRGGETCYKDYMLDELLYDTIEELYEKIRYYTTHKQERYDLVKEQQKKLEPYKVKNWVERLMGEING